MDHARYHSICDWFTLLTFNIRNIQQYAKSIDETILVDKLWYDTALQPKTYKIFRPYYN